MKRLETEAKLCEKVTVCETRVKLCEKVTVCESRVKLCEKVTMEAREIKPRVRRDRVTVPYVLP